MAAALRQRFSSQAHRYCAVDSENESSHSVPNAGHGSLEQLCRAIVMTMARAWALVLKSIVRSRQPATSERRGSDSARTALFWPEASAILTVGAAAETKSFESAAKPRR